MDVEKAKKMTYDSIRKMYKSYLETLELSKNTVQTMAVDAFYLWNNVSKDEFWKVVASQSFEQDAKKSLLKALEANSTGKIEKLLDGYVAHLRKFRTYIMTVDDIVQEETDAEALKNFLLDIECLNPLAEWTNKFNLFDILKITKTEIRHSNMLSWLLNPNENHGLGDSVLRGFLQYVVITFSDDSDVFGTLLMDLHDFVIQREWHNVDILAVSLNEKFVLCIENKVNTSEHDNQLNRYKRIIEENYPEFKKMYIYLSPDGTESSDAGNWCSMSYTDVVEIIENARNKTKLLPDASLLIDNYLEAIRRDIVGDEKLAQICAEIYTKHQKALDLIFENKPDRASDLSQIIKSWAIEKTGCGVITVVEDKCSKSYIRFKTPYLSSILPESATADSGWNTTNHYFYEVRNIEGKEFFIQLSFSGKNLTDEQRLVCDKVNSHFPAKQNKQNWQWRTCFVTKHSKVDDELTEEKIINNLDKKLEEVKSFEEKLKGYFS